MCVQTGDVWKAENHTKVPQIRRIFTALHVYAHSTRNAVYETVHKHFLLYALRCITNYVNALYFIQSSRLKTKSF